MEKMPQGEKGGALTSILEPRQTEYAKLHLLQYPPPPPHSGVSKCTSIYKVNALVSENSLSRRLHIIKFSIFCMCEEEFQNTILLQYLNIHFLVIMPIKRSQGGQS